MYFLVDLIKTDRELNSLILTYGIGVLLTNGILLTWSADIKSTSSAWLQEALLVVPLYSMRSDPMFFLVSVLLMGVMWWWVSRGWYRSEEHTSELQSLLRLPHAVSCLK